VEVKIARRRLGQEQLAVGGDRAGKALEEKSALIDWLPIDRRFDEIYVSAPERSRLAAARFVQDDAAGDLASTSLKANCG
jgi:hypothetical protein